MLTRDLCREGEDSKAIIHHPVQLLRDSTIAEAASHGHQATIEDWRLVLEARILAHMSHADRLPNKEGQQVGELDSPLVVEVVLPENHSRRGLQERRSSRPAAWGSN